MIAPIVEAIKPITDLKPEIASQLDYATYLIKDELLIQLCKSYLEFRSAI